MARCVRRLVYMTPYRTAVYDAARAAGTARLETPIYEHISNLSLIQVLIIGGDSRTVIMPKVRRRPVRKGLNSTEKKCFVPRPSTVFRWTSDKTMFFVSRPGWRCFDGTLAKKKRVRSGDS